MPRNSKHSLPWYRSPEMIIALSAMITSLVAVIVSMYSAYVDRNFARASVWPSIMVAQSHRGEHLEYVVMNQGTGPALIKYAQVSLRDGAYFPDWRSILNALELPEVNLKQSHISSGVIRPGDKITAFNVVDLAATNALQQRGVVIQICYCSVFDECWLASSGLQISAVEQCELPAEEQRFWQ